MKQSKYRLGKIGETLAKKYLQQNGFQILHSNWRSGHYEIDIIAKPSSASVIVFIEVKTRSTQRELNEHTVSEKQLVSLFNAAERYCLAQNQSFECRFDLIKIALTGNQHRLFHYPGIFSPADVE